MLRTATSNIPGLYFIPGGVTDTAGTPSLNFNTPNFNGVTDTGVGRYTVAFKRAFGASSLLPSNVIGSARVAGQSFGFAASSNIAASIELNGYNTSSAAADGGVDFIAYGLDRIPNNVYTDGQYPIRSFQSGQRILIGTITNNGSTATVTLGRADFTAVLTSAGVVTVTYKRPFGRRSVVKASAIGGVFARIQVVPSTTGCVITTTDAAAATLDTDLAIMVVGVDSRDATTSGVLKSVKVSQPQCEIWPLSFLKSGSTYTYYLGDKAFTASNPATGFTKFTLSKKFRRVVLPFASSTKAGEPFFSNLSTNSFEITTGNNAGTAADGGACVLVACMNLPDDAY